MKRASILSFLLACGGEGETDGAAACLDPDGGGGDTGDVPSLIGDWTGDVGQSFLDNPCPADEVPTAALDFLDQPFLLDGSVPAAVRVTFSDNPDYRLRGVASPGGAFAVSGIVEAAGAQLYTSLGGTVWEEQPGRVRWDGAVFIGADVDGDAVIDCVIRGDWKARKSGT
jgi:hypothetical protein